MCGQLLWIWNGYRWSHQQHKYVLSFVISSLESLSNLSIHRYNLLPCLCYPINGCCTSTDISRNWQYCPVTYRYVPMMVSPSCSPSSRNRGYDPPLVIGSASWPSERFVIYNFYFMRINRKQVLVCTYKLLHNPCRRNLNSTNPPELWLCLVNMTIFNILLYSHASEPEHSKV